ncbi:MAG TPA: ABC transporter permease [Candidatus Tyrphobacter sp.]
MMYAGEAWRVLMANTVRSLLTVTGLIIGVGAVIAIQVLGHSMAGAVAGALGGMSDNTFVIFPNPTQHNVQAASIHLRDLSHVASDVPGIAAAFPLAFTTELVHVGHRSGRYGIYADSPISINSTPLLYGRNFTDSDVTSASHAAVISNAAYIRLFPGGGDPTGQSIYAGDQRYVIVGVLQAPTSGLLPPLFVHDVSIPWTTYISQYVHGTTIFAARFMVADPSRIPALELAVENELRALHGNAPGQEYQSFDKAQITQGINGVFNAMTMVVALIGAVSLVVAGIGIMNIMLVSVAERTREIGVRKAIGARGAQILAQFFIEALILCGTGCAIGLAIGLGIGQFIDRVYILKLTGYVAPIPWLSSLAVAAGFAIVVTLAFGTYPAYRASRLDPIEALHYE